MNKEIDKLRNSFQNMNLRNEIMLKNNAENNIRHKNIIDDTTPIFNKRKETLETDEQVRMNNYKNTIINNETTHDTVKTRHPKRRPLDQLQLKQNVIEEFNEIDESRNFNVELKYYSQLHNEVTEKKREENEEENTAEPPNYNDLSITNSKQMTIDTQLSDLQSVLIMMAINSNSNEDEEPDINENGDDILRRNPENPENLILVSNSIQKEARPDFLNISQMKIIVTDRLRILMNKYIKKWRDYVNKRKEYIAQQRQEVINNFFEKLEKKKTDHKDPNEVANKSKQLARDYSTYQHR